MAITTKIADGAFLGFGPINKQNIESLRRLNSVILPVRYSEDFYKMVLDAKYTPPTLTKFAYYNGIVVGAIACRTERARANYDAPGVVQKLGEADTDALYIMTLAVLAPYRRLGIARRLMEHVLEEVQTDKQFTHLKSVYLNVQTDNAAALQFYEKFGFENVKKIEGYYRRITPPDCFVLRRPLSDADADAAAPAAAAAAK